MFPPIKALKKLSVLALAVAAVAVNAVSQQPRPSASWANLNSLVPGSEIRVFLADGRMLRGFLENANADSLTINAAINQEKVPRADVQRVQLKRPGHRGRNTLIGFGIGAGVGVGAGAIIDSRSSNNWFPSAGKAIFTPIGAIIGTVVGVAIPTGGWRQICRAAEASSPGR